MPSSSPRRFPGRRRKHDPAALLLPAGLGLAGFQQRGMGSATPPSALAGAIAQAEGFGSPGAVPTVANNPGDLEIGDVGYGVTTAAGGNKITNFPDAATGYTALQNQINKITSGQSTAGYTPAMSIAQVGQIYSGGSSTWANNVASALGVSPDTSFASVASGSATTADTSTPASSLDAINSSISGLLSGSTTDTSSLMAGGLALGAAALAWWLFF